MKRIIMAFALAAGIVAPAYAGDTYVHGYTRKDGTYVQGYHRTTPNSTKDDNYSTRGNVNPYTGQPGTKPRDEDSTYRPYGGYTQPHRQSSSSYGSNPYSASDDGSDDGQ